MSNQEGRRKAWAELAGISENAPYDDVFMRFAASLGYTGTFNDRMIQYLKDLIGSTSNNLPDLERDVAEALLVGSWNNVGYDIITLSGADLPPIVDAGGAYSGAVSTAIPIDGTVTARTHPITSTLWTIVSGGAGTFGNAALVDTTFTPSVAGPYVLRLTATPSVGSPVSDTANLTSNVIAPTVNAGGPYTGLQSTAISIDGTVTQGTYPITGTLWTIVSGGTGTFGSATTVDTTFTPNGTGTYVLRLTATPSTGSPVSSEATLNSSAASVAPTVNAGGPYTGFNGAAIPIAAVVVLGTDPSPVRLWSIVSGGAGTFGSTTAASTTFTPGQTGPYVLQYSVDPNDGPAVVGQASLQSNVVVPPTVDAGGPYTGTNGTAIPLDAFVVQGSYTGTILWSIVSGGAGTFSNTGIQDPTFTPGQSGPYVLRLTATPIVGAPVFDTADLTSEAVVNPVVDAGGPYAGDNGTAIAISGTITPGTDPTPERLWSIVSGGAGNFANAGSLNTTFTPGQAGPYVLRLTATPDIGAPVADTANLTSAAIVAPTVDAGGPYSGLQNTPIALDGTVTPGSDPSPLVAWTIVSGGLGTFNVPSDPDTTFTPSGTGPYVLRLTATPAVGAPVEDTANLTSNAVVLTVVDAGGPYTGPVDTAIALDGTVTAGSYPVNSTLWSIVSGGTGNFGNAAVVDTTFTPDVLGPYVLRLTATPSIGGSVNDTATLESVESVVPLFTVPRNQEVITVGVVYVVSVQALGNSSVTLTANGSPLGAMTPATEGNFTFNYTPAAVIGAMTLVATGNATGASAGRLITVSIANPYTGVLSGWNLAGMTMVAQPAFLDPWDGTTTFKGAPTGVGPASRYFFKTIATPTTAQSGNSIWVALEPNSPFTCLSLNYGSSNNFLNLATGEGTANNQYMVVVDRKVNSQGTVWLHVQALRYENASVFEANCFHYMTTELFSNSNTISAGDLAAGYGQYYCNPRAVPDVVLPFGTGQKLIAYIDTVYGGPSQQWFYKHPFVDSPANMSGGLGGLPIRILYPPGYDKNNRNYTTLYILPALADSTETAGGNPTATEAAVAGDYQNTYGCIVIIPYDRQGIYWWGRKSDGTANLHDFMISLRNWAIDILGAGPTRESHLLLGYSKSGHAAHSLMLKDPARSFGYAACWDSPMQNAWPNNDTTAAYTTEANFNLYDPIQIIGANVGTVNDKARLCITGYEVFESVTNNYISVVDGNVVNSYQRMVDEGVHSWGINTWMPIVVSALFGLVESGP